MKPANKKIVERVVAAVAIALLLAVGFDVSRNLMRPTRKMADISGTTLAGEAWSLSGRKGKGAVLVNFFATWCGPCRMEMPALAKMQEQYRDRGFQVVALSDESPAVLKADPDVARLPFGVLPNMGQAHKDYGIQGIPHSFFFDRNGKLVKELEGYDEQGLRDVEELLKREPQATASTGGAQLARR